MPRSLLDLPQELVDEVLEYLQDDDVCGQQALQACKLTCKALVEPSRRILHQCIVVSHSLFDRLCGLYTNASVAQYTRRVILFGTSASDAEPPWLLTAACQQALLGLLSKLPSHRIDGLMIFDVHWTLSLSSSIRRCFEHYENVVDIHLEDVFCSTIELHTFLTGFPHLASLVLRDIHLSDKSHQLATSPEATLENSSSLAEPMKPADVMPTDIPHSRSARSLQLQDLELCNCDTPFVQSLFGHNMPTEDLRVVWNDYRTIHVLQELLHNVGKSLESLCVKLKVPRSASGTAREKVQRTLTLEHNPAIASLTLMDTSFHRNTIVDWPWAFLSTVTARNLQEVEFFFTIKLFREDNLLAFDWDRFDQLLSGPQFHHLSLIKVLPVVTAHNKTHDVNRFADSVQDVMKQKLHRLAGRVHICVRVIDEEDEGNLFASSALNLMLIS